ncbi:DUF4834 family protein [Carboxylicivirga sediminis]|uniref:DUF4834 family protein n=1 Tax=Carboxylicivirga sediminis TaxID=2006564 RepID=A0A941FA25_9BACT|nr:DUF4834 family protein [Carboxylicivirga sediminis]MBR8537455.1 DUF4834 family protein [Carboxylicivirga sediminis]
MLIGLAKTIFFLITFYYLFKIIGRLLLPYVMKKGVERMQQQQQQAATNYQQQARKQEGKVTIKQDAHKQSTHIVNDNEGEYVDYEEVK